MGEGANIERNKVLVPPVFAGLHVWMLLQSAIKAKVQAADSGCQLIVDKEAFGVFRG